MTLCLVIVYDNIIENGAFLVIRNVFLGKYVTTIVFSHKYSLNNTHNIYRPYTI